VPKFIAISLIATNPHHYGFHEVRYVPPMDYEEVEVRGSMNLGTLAELAETSLPEIRKLNPALLRNTTPPGKRGYWIKLPTDKAALFLAKVNEEVPEAEPENHPVVTHEVKRGETLFSIARFYGLTVRALMNFNGLTTPQLRIGQKLKILLEGLRRTLP
jgi:membrane-bound lytic murein transglycosylase D